MVTHSRLLLLCVAALWACGDGDAEPTAPPDPPRPTTVTVSPATAELGGVGATVQLSAQVLDQNRQAMASARLTWSSSDATVATVSASGLVTAADRGAAIITATVGDASGTSEIQVVESPDREPLVAFYEALDGAYWFDDENWLTDAPLGEWRGVDTEFGRVVRLDLEGNGLWGPIPSELGNLTSLEGLFLSDNDLWDPIPPELGNLGSLRGLMLPSTELTGPIPSELGNLGSLEWLSLHSSNLSGPIPHEIGNLTSLQFLILGANNLSGAIPPELGNLTGLELLNLSSNQLRGPIPPELGKLTSLERLRFQRNSLSGTIPQTFLELDMLNLLEIQENDGLCLPSTPAFLTWLRGIRRFSGSLCAASTPTSN